MDKRVDKKAQGATEMTIILAIALVALLVIVKYSTEALTETSGAIEAEKANAMLDEIAATAQLIYYQGAGSRTRVYVTIPEEVLNLSIANQRLEMYFYSGGETRVAYRNLGFDVVGSIPVDGGNAWVYIEAKEGYVQIGPNITSLASGCGNNIKDPGEECDGDDFDGQTCITLGYLGGTLLCSSNCTFDYSNCNDINTTPPDTTPPLVTLNYPIDGSTNTSQTLNFKCSASDDEGLERIELWGNFSSTWKKNSSCLVSGTSSSCEWEMTLNNVTYLWNCNASDASGNYAFASQNYTVTIAFTPLAQSVLTWATQSDALHDDNIIGAPDNQYEYETSTYMYGKNFNTTGLSGAITKVVLIWSHEIPGKLNNDKVHLHFGVASYDQYNYKNYTPANTPVDRMGTTAAEWEYYDATSARAWSWADFANLMIGGDYVKAGGIDSKWNLDAVGVNITYQP